MDQVCYLFSINNCSKIGYCFHISSNRRNTKDSAKGLRSAEDSIFYRALAEVFHCIHLIHLTKHIFDESGGLTKVTTPILKVTGLH